MKRSIFCFLLVSILFSSICYASNEVIDKKEPIYLIKFTNDTTHEVVYYLSLSNKDEDKFMFVDYENIIGIETPEILYSSYGIIEVFIEIELKESDKKNYFKVFLITHEQYHMAALVGQPELSELLINTMKKGKNIKIIYDIFNPKPDGKNASVQRTIKFNLTGFEELYNQMMILKK